MYFINTNWKHLQLLTVTFITLETHGTEAGSGIAPRLACGQDTAAGSQVLLSLTLVLPSQQSCPTNPAPRGTNPAMPQGLPSSSLPGLSTPLASKPRYTGSWAQRELAARSAASSEALLFSGALGLCHGCSQTRGSVSPQLQGSSRLLLQDTPQHGRDTVPRSPRSHGPHGTAGQTELGLVPEVAVEPCPGEQCGSLLSQ